MTFLNVKCPLFNDDFSKAEKKQKTVDENFVLEVAWMDVCLVSCW
jgi:hypothetical protein